MSFNIMFRPKAAKFIKKLDKSIRERVLKEISPLSANPKKGKHLSYCNFWSLHIGDYRVIYEMKDTEKSIVILFVGHRKDVYSDFSKIL